MDKCWRERNDILKEGHIETLKLVSLVKENDIK